MCPTAILSQVSQSPIQPPKCFRQHSKPKQGIRPLNIGIWLNLYEKNMYLLAAVNRYLDTRFWRHWGIRWHSSDPCIRIFSCFHLDRSHLQRQLPIVWFSSRVHHWPVRLTAIQFSPEKYVGRQRCQSCDNILRHIPDRSQGMWSNWRTNRSVFPVQSKNRLASINYVTILIHLWKNNLTGVS